MDNSSSVLSLAELVATHRSGKTIGIPAICSANRYVIEACMQQALEDQSLLLVESTSNQVNQYGGYTGMDTRVFAAHLGEMARGSSFPAERLILGGDHLGPGPWANEIPETAMEKGRRLVQASVEAGYQKIHLDASMALGGESTPDLETSAERAAELCQAAENTSNLRSGVNKPYYVIGTEVPPPGGAKAVEGAMLVTRVEDAQQTLEATHRAFQRRGLEQAWERVIALVVQPGVEYGDDFVIRYEPEKARLLSEWIQEQPKLVYEAHSTDYQTPADLRQMVTDHFAILKVGPALTFAFREAVFALAAIEKEWLGESHLLEVVDAAMVSMPDYWRGYYQGDERQLALARKFSLSDRIRYYWALPAVQYSLEAMLTRLEATPLPLALVSQYLPAQYAAIRQGKIDNSPREMIRGKIRETAAQYAWACGLSAG